MKRLVFLLLCPIFVKAQVITTVVGDGIWGYTGDSGLAINAEIEYPVGLNFDDSGNLLVCQRIAVRKVDKLTGIISTIAGSDTASSAGGGGDGGLAISAFLDEPYAICTDAEGDYYIADTWYSEIRWVNIYTGIIDTFAGNRTEATAGDGGPAVSAELDGVFSICFDTAQQYLYISTEFGHMIRRVDMLTDTISAFAGTGVNGYSGDGGPAINATFSRVQGICFDNTNNLYIGDWDNARIRKVDAITGIVTTIAGNGTSGYSGDGGLAINAMINRPTEICFDKCGNLYFSDQDNNRVRRIDGITGVITTIAGNGIAGFTGDSAIAVNAELNNPTGVCIDSSGNLYIGDYNNQRVRKVTIYNPFIKISATPGDTICAGSPVTIQTTLAGGGPAPTFQWIVNGTAMSGTTSGSYTYVPANGDSVSCILTSSSPCVGNPTAASNTIYIVTEAAMIPTISISGPASVAAGSIVTVTATVAGAGSSYTINWYNNSVLFNTTPVPVVTYTKGTGTDHITATVVPESIGVISSCYDSTTSAIDTIAQGDLGVAGASVTSIDIYPNPAHDELTITGNGISSITIINTIGQTLLSKNAYGDRVSMDISALPAGIYLIKITGNNGDKVVRKIIKE